MTESPDVILLRSEDKPDPYLKALRRASLKAVCEPVLTFVYPNQDQLADWLEEAGRYAALVATSPRVGTALGRLFADREDVASRWRGTPAFAVGPKTASRLREAGLEPRGADTGDAAALAKKIADAAPSEPLLFLSGNRRRDTLPNRLREAGLVYDELMVYKTRIRRDVTLSATRPSSDPPWLVFFSPSGREAVEQAPTVDPEQLQHYRLAAIGPTTAGAVEEAGWVVEAVAPEPSPEGLVEALEAAQTPS